MSTEFVICLITWNGQWKKVANSMAYVGGESKLLRVSTKIKLERLKERIYTFVGVDSTSFDLHMSMQAKDGPNKDLGKVVSIVDRNDVRCFLEYCWKNPTYVIPLYVELIPQTIDPQISRGRKEGNVETSNPPQEDTCPNHVTSSIGVTNDEDIKRRRIDPFRWLPEVHDAPVIPIVSKASIGVIGLKMHDIFLNKRELQDALRRHAIQEKYGWKVYKSNKSLFEVKCTHDICKWRARAIVIQDSKMFELRRMDKMDQHTCPRDQLLPLYRQAGKRVADTLLTNKFDQDDSVAEIHNAKNPKR